MARQEFTDSLLRYCGEHSGNLDEIKELDVDIVGAILLKNNKLPTVLNTLIDAGYDIEKQDLKNHIKESDYLFMTSMFDDNEVFLPRYRTKDMWRPVFPRRLECKRCEEDIEIGGKMSVGVCMSCVKKRTVLEGL